MLTPVWVQTIAWLLFLLFLLMDGFVLVKRSIRPWFIGAFWALPLGWLQNGVFVRLLLHEATSSLSCVEELDMMCDSEAASAFKSAMAAGQVLTGTQ